MTRDVPAPPVALHVVRRGEGPTWLLLHASASSHGAWRAFSERLQVQAKLVMPDLLGDGSSAAPGSWEHVIDDELAALERTLEVREWPVVAVGHSYGALIALELARRSPSRVQGLVLLEPIAFHLLRKHPELPEVEALHEVSRRCAELVQRNNLEGAAQVFVRYWAGQAAWDALLPPARAEIARGMPKVGQGWKVLNELPIQLQDYGAIECPTLIVRGTKSPEPTRWIAAQLATVMQRAQLFEIAGAGHMSPLTHAHELAWLVSRHAVLRETGPDRDTLDMGLRDTLI